MNKSCWSLIHLITHSVVKTAENNQVSDVTVQKRNRQNKHVENDVRTLNN